MAGNKATTLTLVKYGSLLLGLLVLVEIAGYLDARNQAVEELHDKGRLLADYQAARLESSLHFAEVASDTLTQVIALTRFEQDEERLTSLIEEILLANPHLSTIQISGLEGGEVLAFGRAGDQMVRAEPIQPVSTNLTQDRDIREEGRWIIPQSDPAATHLYHIQSLSGVTVIVALPIRHLAEPLGNYPMTSAYGFLTTGAVVHFTVPGILSSKRLTEFCNQMLTRCPKEGRFIKTVEPLYGQNAWVGTSQVGDLDLTAGVVFIESENLSPIRGLSLRSFLLGLWFLLALGLSVRVIQNHQTSSNDDA